MVHRVRRVLLAFGLILVSVALSISVGFAQAVGVTPGSAPPGTEITVFGDGHQPGDEITVFFGGTEVVTFVDDNGSFTVSLTVDELMPPGMHPLDISGFPSNYFATFDYQVEEPPPPTTTTTQPTTTTTVAPTSTEAVTTTEATTTTEGVTTTEAATTTEAPGIVEDTRVSTSDGGGVPWWLFLVAILVALALGAGVMMAMRPSTAKAGAAFTDSTGTEWKYCAARACRVKMKTVTKTPGEGGRQVLVSAQPRGTGCAGAGCSCVLFQMPKGGAAPIMLNATGGWVKRVGGAEYSARCVEKA